MLPIPIRIRPLRFADIDATAEMVSAAHQATPTGAGVKYASGRVGERLFQALHLFDGTSVLVAELFGEIVGVGMVQPVSFAAATWALSLGATRPDLQGHGIGRALVQARLEIARHSGAGVVLVSAKSPGRWQRYGFAPSDRNPVSGAQLLTLRLRAADENAEAAE